MKSYLALGQICVSPILAMSGARRDGSEARSRSPVWRGERREQRIMLSRLRLHRDFKRKQALAGQSASADPTSSSVAGAEKSSSSAGQRAIVAGGGIATVAEAWEASECIAGLQQTVRSMLGNVMYVYEQDPGCDEDGQPLLPDLLSARLRDRMLAFVRAGGIHLLNRFGPQNKRMRKPGGGQAGLAHAGHVPIRPTEAHYDTRAWNDAGNWVMAAFVHAANYMHVEAQKMQVDDVPAEELSPDILRYNNETAGDVVESALAWVGSTTEKPGAVRHHEQPDASRETFPLCVAFLLALAAMQDAGCVKSRADTVQDFGEKLLNAHFHHPPDGSRGSWPDSLQSWLEEQRVRHKHTSEARARKSLKKHLQRTNVKILPAGRVAKPLLKGVWADISL